MVHGGGDILDWINWTDRAWKKLSDSTLDNSDIIKSFLCARIMSEGRPKSAAISIQWGDTAMLTDEERVVIFIGDREHRLSQVDLRIDEFSEDGPILFSVCADDITSSYQLVYDRDTNKSVVFRYEKLSDITVRIKFGAREAESLEDYARRDPFVVIYADGSRSYNQFIVDNPAAIGLFDTDRIIPIDWVADGVDIRVESQGPGQNPSSIQNRMVRYCRDDYEIVFDDDGSGEAGDLVCLRNDRPSNSIEILLVHCKFSLADSAGARVKDLYEVSGQAQKCIHWKHNGFTKLVTHMKSREEKWRVRGNSRFLKGDLAHLSVLKDVARKAKTRLEVWIVQPGVSKRAVTNSMRLLLGATDEYLSQTSNAHLKVFSSP